MSKPSRRDVIRPEFRVTEGWAYPIIDALNKTELRREPEWSEANLGNLALSIETGLAVMAEVADRIRGSLTPLQAELDAETDIAKFVNHYGFRFDDYSQLTRLQANVHGYAVEARAFLENLVGFYRGFCSSYLGRSVSKPESFDHIEELGKPGTWFENLNLARHNIAHGSTPWLQFELLKESPREYELLIDFNGTPREILTDDPKVVTLSQLFQIEPGLVRARTELRSELVSEVQMLKQSKKK